MRKRITLFVTLTLLFALSESARSQSKPVETSSRQKISDIN